MKYRDLVARYGVFVVGLYFLALGVVLIVRSNLGTTPISSANYVLSLNTPLTLGACTFITNFIYVFAQLFLVRGLGLSHKDIIEIWAQIPFSFLFGAFIDLNMNLTSGYVPANYVLQIVTLLVGCVVQAFGVVVELRPNVSIMSAEGFVKYFIMRYPKYEFGRTKVKLDVCLVLIAIVLSLSLAFPQIQGVREGTVIAALITGFIVSFISKRVVTVARYQHVVDWLARKS